MGASVLCAGMAGRQGAGQCLPASGGRGTQHSSGGTVPAREGGFSDTDQFHCFFLELGQAGFVTNWAILSSLPLAPFIMCHVAGPESFWTCKRKHVKNHLLQRAEKENSLGEEK